METAKTRRFNESTNHQPIREEGTDHVIGKSQSRASNSRQLTGLTVLFTIITAIITILSSLFWFGLVWFGLVWFGLVRFDLVYWCRLFGAKKGGGINLHRTNCHNLIKLIERKIR